MPSAADNVKVDGKSGGKNQPQQQQQAPVADNGLPDSNAAAGQTMFKQIITFTEHKIRNLEKRKSKLESYRDLQKAGKELNSDQKTAVAKYDEVTHTLEFARDMCKNFVGFSNSSEKEAKKQAKREATQRLQAELARIREIILIQDALDQMGNDKVRADFLAGINGAPKLSEIEMKLLDSIYPVITPKHEPGNPTAFSDEVQGAAEHLHGIVEGKLKEVCGGNYAQIKEVLGKIHESGYFDQAQPAEGDDTVTEELLTDIPVDQTDVSDSFSREDPSSAPVFVSYNVSAGPVVNTTIQSECSPAEGAASGSGGDELPSNRALHPIACGAFVAAPQHRQATGGAVPQHRQPTGVPPPAPSQLDEEPQTFYRPTQMQASKPISDLVGDTSYIFLQESEIDESGGGNNNTCPVAGTGPTPATSTNGIHPSSFYRAQLPLQHPPPTVPCPAGGGGESNCKDSVAHAISGAAAENSGGVESHFEIAVAHGATGAAVLQRPTTGVGAGPVAAAPLMGSSTNGTAVSCPAPSTNRRGTGGGGSGSSTQSSYYTSTTLEHERAGPNFVPANIHQQLNASDRQHQGATAGAAVGRTNYYNANADSSDRSDRSYTRNNRTSHGNSRNAIDCGFYSGGGGGGGETVASSNRTSRGGQPGASHSYYQNNAPGFPKNGTRGQQQRSGNSRSNKIQ